ncbi:MAG: putative quinol monooxygenase [Gemmatimonadales bacterium]
MVVHWYVKPGQLAEAEAALGALEVAVKANEPGTWMYLIHVPAEGSLPPAADGTVTFMEGYADEAALQAHITGPAYTAFLKAHGDLFVQAFTGGPFMLIEDVQRVAGFVRPQATGS